MNTYIPTHVHIHTYLTRRVHMYMPTHIHIPTHTHSHTYTPTHVHIYTCTHIHTYTHTPTQVSLLAHLHLSTVRDHPQKARLPLNRKQRVSLEAGARGASLLLLPALPSTGRRHTLDPDFYPADVSRTFTPVV